MDLKRRLSETVLTDGNLGGVFVGWGEQRVVAVLVDRQKQVSVIADTIEGEKLKARPENEIVEKKGAGLGVLHAVSIAGCDLLGSCLYTAGVCAGSGGKLAPIGLALVTLMLFFFRLVYSEVVTALPVNGGTYNLLLNTVNKKAAGFVACLSLLSYTATCIVSAFDAVLYLAIIWPEANVRGFTVLIIGAFTCITLCGVKESSTVTLFLFLVHTLTISVLVIWGIVYGFQDEFQVFENNTHAPLPDIRSSYGQSLGDRSVAASVFFGYSSALLGITGFETASNYVEDLQSPATFISTVNWMWLLAGMFNPVISVVSMMVLPMDVIYDHPSDMLAVMADYLGGKVFKTFLCIDAVMVLCGGVLTAIVGVTGLIDRLAKDKVVPEQLALISSWGASYVAIIAFSIFCITLFLAIFDPEDPTGIDRFGGVFAISFLSVLAAFAFSAILLKLYRPNLARMIVTRWWQVVFSLVAVLLGLIGNILLTPDVFIWFLLYLFALVLLVVYMFTRVDLQQFAIYMIRKINLAQWNSEGTTHTKRIGQQEIVGAYRKQTMYEESDVWDQNTLETEMTSPPRRRASNTTPVDAGDVELAAFPRYQNMSAEDHADYAAKFPIRSKLLTAVMSSLDSIVSEPFVYFAKRPDPVSIHMALEYIVANEQSNNIFVVHFVDDRLLCRNVQNEVRAEGGLQNQEQVDGQVPEDRFCQLFLQKVVPRNDDGELYEEGYMEQSLRDALPVSAMQVVNYVTIIDTFYPYKKVNSIIVRGAYYCPSAVKAICNHLHIRTNSSIMGVPDTCFKFPFSMISGCRLVVQDPSDELRNRFTQRLSKVIKKLG